ncbi:MAG: S1C family serine protease [Actinomycetota bacterium]
MTEHPELEEPALEREPAEATYAWDDGISSIAEPPPAEPAARARPVGAKLVAVALVAAIGGGIVGGVVARASGSAPAVERVTAPASAISDRSPTGVAAVAKSVLPSIVRIDVTGASTPFGGSSEATGSGVIFTRDGYILTNNHVTEGATSLHVTLSTGQKLAARLVGTASPADDIAVIKVDRTGLPAATFGSTSSLSVGDVAVAIGSPFGLQGTVTAGVISALHRNINLGGESLSDAIQTDAPINPGNSGGALADGSGNVVGINTAILGGGSGNVGVGFAIPIDIARRDAEQIIKTGHAQRPLLGITGESSPNGDGALIQEAVAGGPAAKAGIRAGDLITAVDAHAVTSMDDLVAVLGTYQPGDTVTITYIRDGGKRTSRATLATRTT